MRPVCVKCGREMQCEKNGVVVYHPYERPDPGPTVTKTKKMAMIHLDRLLVDSIDTTKVDFVVRGDKYRCPVCGFEVVTGFGGQMVDGQWPQEQLKNMISSPGVEAIEILRR